MESSVYFKFKSQKEPTRVEFDGTGISVFELKRDIILKSGLGDGTDFDLAIYTEDGNEEYDDDTTIIPRSTTVVARRLPPMKPGAGRAARYVSGKMPSHAKNHSRREQAVKAAAKSQSEATQQMHNAMTEEEKLAAMFKAQSDVLATNEEELARTAPVFRPTNKKAANVPDHDPPNGYICYRCGEKGHWIMLCPTNDNPEYDNRPRVKRTTGIPRSFLKTVDKSTALGQNGDDEAAKPPTGLMVNADGEFVVAEPDKASWAQFQAKAKNAASKEAAQDGDKDLQERGLECSIDKKMFLDPMKTPCCEKTYCNECITNALIVSDFVCPGCQSDGVLLDDLKQDNETAERIKDYLAARDKAKEEKTAKESRSAQAKSPASEKAEVAKVDKEEIKATADSSKKTSTTANIITKSPAEQKTDPKNVDKSNLKKRPADELLENLRIPKGPKAMQQPSHSNMNNMMGMNGMNGMPMMPLGMNMNFPMPMMPMNMYGNFPNMMSGMNGFSNGGGSFNGMNGGNMGMGIPSMNTMSNMNGGGDFVGNGGGMNDNQAYRNGGYSNGGFNNYHGGNQQWRKFNNPQHNEEEDAYFRKPVNPHRHQNRMRRTRPSDYREL